MLVTRVVETLIAKRNRYFIFSQYFRVKIFFADHYGLGMVREIRSEFLNYLELSMLPVQIQVIDMGSSGSEHSSRFAIVI